MPSANIPFSDSFSSLFSRTFACGSGSQFLNVLRDSDVDAAFEAQGRPLRTQLAKRLHPALTLWALVFQILSHDQSCRAAVACVATLLVVLGRRPRASLLISFCVQGGSPDLNPRR